MEIGVGLLFLAVLCVEIALLPVWAAIISICGIKRLSMTSSTTPLNSWTSKTWVLLLEFCYYVPWNSVYDLSHMTTKGLHASGFLHRHIGFLELDANL